MDYDKLMKRARAVNRKRDVGDRKMAPFHRTMNKIGAQFPIEPGAPSDLRIVDHIRTAMMAIECGIKTDDWNNIAEGQAMLEEVVQRLGKN